jgi:hypothetical protein
MQYLCYRRIFGCSSRELHAIWAATSHTLRTLIYIKLEFSFCHTENTLRVQHQDQPIGAI